MGTVITITGSDEYYYCYPGSDGRCHRNHPELETSPLSQGVREATKYIVRSSIEVATSPVSSGSGDGVALCGFGTSVAATGGEV